MVYGNVTLAFFTTLRQMWLLLRVLMVTVEARSLRNRSSETLLKIKVRASEILRL